MHLIGIAGPARSGKNTVAEILSNQLEDYKTVAFADPIKQMLEVININTADDLKTEGTYLGPLVTPRMLMQTLGTEWGRSIDENIWLKVFVSNLREDSKVIVPDVRFENEADLIRTYGTLIHITGRGGIPGNHESEAGVRAKKDDVIINNIGTIEDLEKQISHLRF